jgi:hypothetical protein
MKRGSMRKMFDLHKREVKTAVQKLELSLLSSKAYGPPSSRHAVSSTPIVGWTEN